MSKKRKAKNTVNKAKHTKLIKQKVLRITHQKKQHKLRLKEIIKKMNRLKLKVVANLFSF